MESKLGIKILDKGGPGTDTGIIKGIKYAVEKKRAYDEGKPDGIDFKCITYTPIPAVLYKKPKCGRLRRIGTRALSGVAGIIGAGIGLALGPFCGIAAATYTAFTGKAPSDRFGKDHWIDGWMDVGLFDVPAKLALSIKNECPERVISTALALTTLPYAALVGLGMGAAVGFIIPSGGIMYTLGKHCF